MSMKRRHMGDGAFLLQDDLRILLYWRMIKSRGVITSGWVSKTRGKHMAHEMRMNRLTGQWVIYATARGHRPHVFKNDGTEEATPVVEHNPKCPFCVGNEDQLPDIIMETMNGNHWQVRVVPNKFPMLVETAESERQADGLFVFADGHGKHEVVIEHPFHNADIPNMSINEVHRLIDTYYWRYIRLMAEHNAMSIFIFRNHGREAGASLEHPHSQLVVTGIVPREVRVREQIAQEYYDVWGRCLMQDLIAQELQADQRIIDQNDSFVSFVPYAAEVPFEIYLVPKRQQADFGDITDIEQRDMAAILHSTLSRLKTALDDPHYNYVIHSAARFRADEPHLQWFMQIRPYLTKRAGFELGTGMRVNPSLPEADAAVLRGQVVADAPEV
jgi:UDPglucose--hexose-1-phosphate uridylyltransferase